MGRDRYAREVAELYSTEHQEFHVEPQAMEILPRLVWHYGEPFADQSAIPTFYLSELTRRSVTVALNGDGGDENFAGYTRYVSNSIADRLGWIPRPLARAGARAMQRIGPGPQARSLRSRLGRVSRALAMDPVDRYALWMAYLPEHDRASLYTSEMRAALPAERLAPSVVREPYELSDATE